MTLVMAANEGVPIGRRRDDGTWEIYGYATFLPCDNCGITHRVAEMLANGDGTFDCTECDGKTYVQRRRERQRAVLANARAAKASRVRA